MTDAQYNNIVELLTQLQGAVLGLSLRMDKLEERVGSLELRFQAHESKSQKEHHDIIASIGEVLQITADSTQGDNIKIHARLDNHEGRIRTIEQVSF